VSKPAQAFERAIELHRKGQLAQAIAAYDALLERWPAHAEQIALSITRRMGKVSLKESPLVIRSHIAGGKNSAAVTISIHIRGCSTPIRASKTAVSPNQMANMRLPFDRYALRVPHCNIVKARPITIPNSGTDTIPRH